MARSKTIRVTPNVKKCLSELKAAVNAMPDGEKKDNAKGAINYLSRTFQGKPQPGRGIKCPGSTKIIKI